MIVLFGATAGIIVLPVEIATLYFAFLQTIIGVNNVIMNMEDTMMNKNKMESGTHGAVQVF